MIRARPAPPPPGVRSFTLGPCDCRLCNSPALEVAADRAVEAAREEDRRRRERRQQEIAETFLKMR